MSSRVSGWFVLSAVFIVAVFGLFFTFTERKTWPEHRIELSATDQRLIPPTSTVWCEAIALYSDHPFVAYQAAQSPVINSNLLRQQKVSLHLEVDPGRNFQLKYFLLTSSHLQLTACASRPGAKMLIFKGEDEVGGSLQNLHEEEDFRKESSSLIRDILVDEGNCEVRSHPPLKLNITQDGFYVIVALNTDVHQKNHVFLQLLIDRSRYTITKSRNSFDMCSLSTACTIGLSFASEDGALVWIPEEEDAGRTSFVVRSRCKPRLAVFAILSVFVPLTFFVLVAFFVRADKERIRRIYRRQETTVAPLLPDVTPGEPPPPYYTLYDLPPPYTCLKVEAKKQSNIQEHEC